MTTAFLFAGQGSQSVGMGRALSEACPDCRALFDAADEALGFPLTRVMQQGPADELRRTAVAQPALLVLSVAHARHRIAQMGAPAFLAGHSLGQYSALVVGGALDLADAVRLVRERGRLMQQAVPEGKGAMAAVLDLDRARIREICREAPGVVGIACHNSPGQTVISGETAAVAQAAERCEAEGAGILELPVSAPFHTALLEPMVPAFAGLVDAVRFTELRLPVIDNVTAQPLRDAADVRRSLVLQLTAPVLFEESLQLLAARGVDAVVQCGPGRSALGFAKRTMTGVTLTSLDELPATSAHHPSALPTTTQELSPPKPNELDIA